MSQTFNTQWASTAYYVDSFTFVHVDEARTSQEAQTSTVRYRDRFPFVYVDDVRTSQETRTCLHGLLLIHLLFICRCTLPETRTCLHGLLRGWLYDLLLR
jgi:hypothetical protein